MSKILKYTKLCLKYSIIGGLTYLAYFQLPVRNEIIYVKNDQNNVLVKTLLPLDYKPTFFLPTCLSQMYYSVYFRSEIKVKFRRQYIETDDGGVISLEWPNDKDVNFDKLLVILPGLTGDASDPYIKEIIQEFDQYKGYKIVVLQYRGVANIPLFTSKSYHCGYTDDLSYVMNYLYEKYPDKRCYVIGCSMGANIFTLLFSKHHELKSYIKGFVSLSNPLNCHEIEKRNRHGVIDAFLLKQQLNYVKKHKDMLSLRNDINIEEIMKAKNYRDFDNLYTAKVFGFKDAEDYYRQTSSMNFIDMLDIPSLFLNARDDRLSPIDSIDMEKIRKNPNIILILTRYGGHITWFKGLSTHSVSNYLECLDKLYLANEVILEVPKI